MARELMANNEYKVPIDHIFIWYQYIQQLKDDHEKYFIGVR